VIIFRKIFYMEGASVPLNDDRYLMTKMNAQDQHNTPIIS